MKAYSKGAPLDSTGSCPGHAITGSLGYFGNRSSVEDLPHSVNRAPRLLVIVRACRHVAQRPCCGSPCPLFGPWFIMDVMFMSEATTRGIRVSVLSEYAPDRSRPHQQQWFFLYTITITNGGADTVQLLSRHWIITDGSGHVEEVKGPGVVGQQPILGPGQAFTYTSGCPLGTPFGTMQGTYQMMSRSGETFDVTIAPFTLSEPYTVH